MSDEPDVELLELLSSALDDLGERPSDVLSRRLGLGSHGSHTLQDVGDAYGVSRERVRQIQQKAVARLRSQIRLRRGRDSGALARHLEAAVLGRSSLERGRYIRCALPEAQVDVLARVFSAGLVAVDESEIKRWIDRYESKVHADDIAVRRGQISARLLQGVEARIARILKGALWPAGAPTDRWRSFSPCRNVSLEGGARWSSKLGRNVQYESGLEASIIRLLDEASSVLDYCEQPLAIEYQWFDGPRKYVPDLAVHLADGRSLLIEVKPRTLWADGQNLAKWNAATRWSLSQGWGFAVTDGRRHPGELLSLAADEDGSILEALTQRGPARWPAVDVQWFGSGRSWTALLAASLRYGFALQRGPFEVRRARNSPWLDALRNASEGDRR